jgi:radical SAM enzyme (TIGR01210 family)
MPVMALSGGAVEVDPDAAPGPRLVRGLRGPRAIVDPAVPVAVWDEEEVERPGAAVPTRVAILAGAECRFTCAMCDLWRHTLPGPTRPGLLPRQVRLALDRDRPPPPDAGIGTDQPAAAGSRWLKLYNASNFFDPRAVPPADLPVIAELVAGVERLVVENHPRLTDDAVPRFRDRCRPRLEVAMGLETVHEDVLDRLGKTMTLDDFAAACARLVGWDIDIRAFVLLGLPWVEPGAAVDWCARGVAFAAAHGVRHVSIVPTRPGNGLLDALAATGRFVAPDAAAVERVAALLVDRVARPFPHAAGTVVTVDLWDFGRLSGTCDRCRGPRRERLARMNLWQAAEPPPAVGCGCPA